jgi:hypothetical protein
MEKINEITIPEGVNRIAVKQHDDKIVIEFIPEKRKFKAGDVVRIKDGISSETHGSIKPNFISAMGKFIGKKLTVEKYSSMGFVVTDADYFGYHFAEDWLEPWSDEPKNGDLAIFWDDHDIDYSSIRMYDRKGYNGYYDSSGIPWDNAIKFESKDQFEKILRGEI